MALFVGRGTDLPLIKCPGCGLVHTVDFQEARFQAVGELNELRLKDYYLDTICDSELADDSSPPDNPAEDKTVSPGTYVWLGIRVWNSASRNPIAATLTLRVRQNSGSWYDLGGGTQAQSLGSPGTGNMQWTDLTPANTNWFCQTACGGTLETDGVAEDNDAVLTVDVQEDYESECWWAIDTTGGSGVYTFSINDTNGQFADASPLLDSAITVQVTPLTKNVSESLSIATGLD
jgi:hypothetical protein